MIPLQTNSTGATGIPPLASWADILIIIFLGIPVVIQLYRIFF